jgi:outer membrane biosynthesis protein TonB
MRRWLTLTLVGVLTLARAVAQEQTPARRRIMSQVQPAYPDLARKMQMIGTVKIRVVIATNGRLKSAQVMGGSPVLAKATTDALD